MSDKNLWPAHESPGDLDTDWNFDGGDVVGISYTLDDEVIIAKVSSHAMILASPVWKRFVHPPWQPRHSAEEGDEIYAPEHASEGDIEGGSKAEKHIDFTEDNGEALLIVLQIVHLRFGKVPKEIGSAMLLEIAKLNNQYQFFTVLEPWLRSWIEHAEKEGYEVLGKERWLFIYWAFGEKEEFTKLAGELVRELRSMVFTRQYFTSTNKLLLEPTPTDIIESIAIQRLDTIRLLLAIPYSLVDTFEHGCSFSCAEPSREAMMYGSLLLALQGKKLWPRVTTENVSLSVQELADAIRQLRITTLVDEPRLKVKSGLKNSHPICRQRCFLGDRVTQVMDEIKSPVLESHKIHMTAIGK